MLTLTDTELADFRAAAHAAIATQEFLEYLGQCQLNGELIHPSQVERIQNTMKPTMVALYNNYKRTKSLPRLRYRGFVFSLWLLLGDIIDLQVMRE